MPLQIGNTSISKIYIGSTNIPKAYLGTVQVFPVAFTAITDFDFYTAVDLWFTDQPLAESTYGLIGDWGVSAVTNMSSAFYPNRWGGSATNTFNEDISSWDVSSVISVNSMFYQATSFNQSLNWDTSSVTDMSDMFSGATSFNQLLTFSDTSNVLYTLSMFRNATSFNQPLNWDISSVIDMSNMFLGVNLSTTNYDLILVAWEGYLQTAFPSGVGYNKQIYVSFNTTKYTAGSAAATARASLISNFGWTITDGGSI